MSVYDGQYLGKILPLDGEKSDLLFSEADRRAAYGALSSEASVDTNAVVTRLEVLSDAGSHQAEFLLGLLRED